MLFQTHLIIELNRYNFTKYCITLKYYAINNWLQRPRTQTLLNII